MKKFINILEKKVFIENDRLTNYDIAIIFGGPDMIPYRVDKAIELYNNKQIKKILVSGGIGYFKKRKNPKEAELMKQYLLNNNISKKDILIEDTSKSTKKNIKYSIELLKKKTNFKKLKILLISSDYHIKRCKILFLKCCNNCNNKLSIFGTKNPLINKDNWFKSLKGYITIIKEYILS
ncbi:MAG: YdcF family protein [Candidatus Coprovivens sp.]